jgi:hypothetical protein
MKRPPGVLSACWMAGLAVVTQAAGPRPTEAARAEGQALAAELRAAMPPENLEVNGLVRVRDSHGRRTKTPFRYQVIVGERSWRGIYATRGSATVPAEQLVVVHDRGGPNHYLLSRGDGADGSWTPQQPLSAEEAMRPFAQSDFWLADLGLEFLHWPEHRLVEETKLRMRKGRPCKVLESVNPRPGAVGYTRVRSWVDAEQRAVLMAEAYDADGKLLKEFEVGGLTKVNGQWELKNLEMRNRVTDTQTVLEFKYEALE